MKLTTTNTADLQATPHHHLGGDLTAAVQRFAVVARWTMTADNDNNTKLVIAQGEELLASIPSEDTALREQLLASLQALRAA